MPFGLKNVGATYQHAMSVIFHDLIHIIMEDYVDKLLGKSKTREEHPMILKKIFEQLEHYKLHINPKNCGFGVTSRKLLCFIVSKRGIEVDTAKVKEIIEIPPPCNLKQLRILQGKLHSIKWFMAQLANKFQSFTHLLCKDITFKWDPECQ